MRELQALGGVERHQGDGVALELLFLVVGFVAVAQRDVVKEAAERRLSGIGRVVGGGVDELFDAGGAGFALRGVGVEAFELAAIAGAVDGGGEEFVGGLAGGEFLESVDEGDELDQRFEGGAR